MSETIGNRYEFIKKFYYDPEEGFLGENKLYQKLKQYGISRGEIKAFLKKQEAVQVSKKPKGKQNSFIPRFPLQEFQADLIFLSNPNTDTHKYGVSVIDAFTKKAHIELLNKKDTTTMVGAFKKVFDIMGVPKMMYFDEGTEFNNAKVMELLKGKNIKPITTYSHAPFIERFHRTIKEMMEKYFISHNTKNIGDVVHKLVNNYNNSYHVAIGMAPNKVNEENMHLVQQSIIKHSTIKKRPEIQVGDKVRIQKKDEKLRKCYKPKFTHTLFKVERIEKPYYYLEGENRPFLRAHLQKVDEVDKYELPKEVEEKKPKRVARRGKESNIPVPNLQEENRKLRERKPRHLILDEYGRAVIA